MDGWLATFASWADALLYCFPKASLAILPHTLFAANSRAPRTGLTLLLFEASTT
jgi:hypothetical protein